MVLLEFGMRSESEEEGFLRSSLGPKSHVYFRNGIHHHRHLSKRAALFLAHYG